MERAFRKKILTIFVGFVHDFAAGCWAATLLVVWWLERVQDEALLTLISEIQKEFFYIGIACIATVLVAGVGRTFSYAYIGSVYGEESERLRKKMLLVKHIILISIFSIGTYWQYTVIFR